MLGKLFRRKSTKAEQSANAAVERLLLTLRGLGLQPRHIVDIGANHGGWSRVALSVFPGVNLTLFEPQQSLSKFMVDLEKMPNVSIRYEGVGDIDGQLPFTFHDRDDSCSFVYDAEVATARGFTQSKINISRLDTALTDSLFPPPDIVKIDAEGLDLKVLEGAPFTLKTTQVVLVEASVANRDYPNSVLEVVTKMDALGFRLFDITDLNRTPTQKVLWLIEAVFVRKGSAIDRAGSQFA